MPTTTRVLIVDDDESLRVLLEAALSGEEDITIVGVSSDASSALVRAAQVSPDVVVLDNKMPGLYGIEVLRDLVDMGVPTVIVYTAADLTATEADQVRLLGATVITKGPNTDVLLDAIRGATR
jgi:DNA-binding NarL/FixJ family response regulator